MSVELSSFQISKVNSAFLESNVVLRSRAPGLHPV